MENTPQEILRRLLLRDTPEEVCERYLTLADRARDVSFGLLESDIVMLDTETTGLSYRKNDLIEIAAARINGREVVDRFQTFVLPSHQIPAKIQVLTGITEYDVCNAPTPEEAVCALAEFVGAQPVVAHNASFDRTFIQKVPGGKEVTDTWIDSLVLSRIALPRLSSHRLSDMAEAFGCAPVTHRAMADVDALCGMWRILLTALLDLPGGVLSRMADMHADRPWSYRPILRQLAGMSQDGNLTLKDIRRMVVGHTRVERLDAREIAEGEANNSGSLVAVPRDLVDEAFGETGIVSSMYDAYELREEQVAMAQEVCSALNESKSCAIEAGTGVGKSVAYLLPSVLYAQRNKVGVGVATKTNALTDQLVSYELPTLDKQVPGGISFMSLKGYDHYPCLHRVDVSCLRDLPTAAQADGNASEDDAAQDMLNALAVVLAFASQSPDGDLDALGIRWNNVPRSLITTTSHECLRGRCPYYRSECFVHGARERAASADIVVTNHSLLLRDIELDNAILPPIRHWIVDEAHSFEREARRQWAQEISSEAVGRVFTSLGGPSSGKLQNALRHVSSLEGATLLAGLVSHAAVSVQTAQAASADLLLSAHQLISLARGNDGYSNITLWISDDVRKTDEWHALEACASRATGALEEAAKRLDAAIDELRVPAPQLASDLSEGKRGIADLLGAVRLIVLEPDDEYVYSAELYRAKRRQSFERLVAEKIDVGSELAERWYPEALSVVYTSATIAVDKSFDHFDHAVGFDQLSKGSYKNLTMSSSYDYDSNMSVVVARDMPEPNDRSYIGALEDLLFDVHSAMEGSVLTLFTNRREMERVYQSLRPRLQEVGLDLVCQERRSSPRRLREQFMEHKSLSLFALKSFWEGFDAAGETLRCVVIPRLPFASPNDPLMCERRAREGSSSWRRYALPEAVLTVKQAAGRLIRSSTDTGVLVLADSRIVTKGYGTTFLRALPTTNSSRIERANISRYLKLWRVGHER